MSDYKPLTCLPVLPLRGIVVFPGCVTHFDVGRTKSVRSVEEAMRANQTISDGEKTCSHSFGNAAFMRRKRFSAHPSVKSG